MGDLREHLEHPGKQFRQDVYEEYSVLALKTCIIVWALFVIGLALFVNDKWLLAGILAWELLP
jgi:hypothetical protein